MFDGYTEVYNRPEDSDILIQIGDLRKVTINSEPILNSIYRTAANAAKDWALVSLETRS